jgi:hypothetical protein
VKLAQRSTADPPPRGVASFPAVRGSITPGDRLVPRGSSRRSGGCCHRRLARLLHCPPRWRSWMKRIKLLGLAAMMLVPIGAVYGGAHSSALVSIQLDDAGNVIGAMGNEADAFNSVDSNQYIGCGGTSDTGFCQAHDATADADGVLNFAICFTANTELLAQIRSVAADSFVLFTMDPTTGECTKIRVSHNSFYRPKAP